MDAMMLRLHENHCTALHACVLLGVLLPGAATAVAPRLEAQARIHQDTGEVVQRSVAPGAVLSSGDDVRLRVTAWTDGYLYVVALGSSGAAVVLHPFAGPAEPVRAGEELAVPRDGGFLPLDSRTGPEHVLAFVSDKPLESLARLRVRLEAAGAAADAASLRELLASEGFEAAHLSFGHGPAAITVAPAPARSLATGSAAAASPQPAASAPPPAAGDAGQSAVLSGLGSRIARFTSRAPGAAAAPQAATVDPVATMPPPDSAAETRADAPADVAPIPRAAGETAAAPDTTGRDSGNPGGWLAGLGAFFGGSREPAPTADATAAAREDNELRLNTGPEPTLSRRADESGRSVVMLDGAAPPPPRDSEVLSGSGSRIRALLDEPEPPRTVMPAPPEDPRHRAGQVAPGVPAQAAPAPVPAPAHAVVHSAAPLAPVDLSSNAGAAAAVVMVVTPEGATSGVLVNERGHVLTNWHSVRAYDAVLVLFKQADGTGPAVATRSLARLVAHSKFADLALLQVDSLPSGIAPPVLVSRVEVDAGAPLHAIGPGDDGQWRHSVATVDRIRRNSSWYSTRRVLHRADVVRAEMADPQDVAGVPLFNNALELVGLGAMSRGDKGELIGISAGTLRSFLAAAGD
jgi:hypothetical protein